MPPAPKSNSSMMIVVIVVVIIVIAGILGYGAYAGWFNGHPASSSNLTIGVSCPQPISGAGSTFVFPAMSAWAGQFSTDTSSCIQAAYSAVGSGAGITQLTSKAVEFGASDAPLSYAQTKALPGAAMTIPEAIGPVTVVYNSGNLPKGLNLTGSLVAQIYMGNITNWNDSAIKAINPGVNLPNQAIAVVHRSDSSGTSFVFTGWLSLESPAWKASIGQGTAPVWPVGTGARGSGGVVGTVGSTVGAIGYAELNYAEFGSGVYTASLQNPAGNYIQPSIASTEPAVSAVAGNLPPGSGNWSAVSMLNQPGAGTYPMATFTYLIVYSDMGAVFGSAVSQSQAQATVNFIWWIIHDGQSVSSALYYVPIPDSVVSLNQATLSQMTYNGAAYQMPS